MADDGRIKVFCRVRPPNECEGGATSFAKTCVTVPSADPLQQTVLLQLKGAAAQAAPKTFTFDRVFHEHTSQNDVFEVVGVPITKACLEGYNGTIFAYGQTGSGKTFTMQGPKHVIDKAARALSDAELNLRGLVPRVFDYVFEESTSAMRAPANGVDRVEYTFSCTFVEIYNERMYDLLGERSVGDATVLTPRKYNDNGVTVEGLTEAEVSNAQEAAALMATGARKRRVAQTAMNRESSRSHSVFVLQIHSTTTCADGLTHKNTSRLTLVDLAGSERQKKNEAVGEQFNESVSINKSLSALGNVIMALGGKSAGKECHVPYRDSTLTFLLGDSLGGNSKTVMIATVSPAEVSARETLSTLQFAARAKRVRINAVINEVFVGKATTMQEQAAPVRRLFQEFASPGAAIGFESRLDTVHALNAAAAEKQQQLELVIHDLQAREVVLLQQAATAQQKLEYQLAEKTSVNDRLERELWESNEKQAATMVILERLQAELAEHKRGQDAARLEREGECARAASEAKEKTLRIKASEGEIARLNALLQSAAAEQDNTKAELSASKKHNDNHSRAESSLRERISHLEQMVSSLQDARVKLTTRFSASQADVSRLTETNTNLTNRLNETEHVLHETRETLSASQRSLETMSTDLDSARNETVAMKKLVHDLEQDRSQQNLKLEGLEKVRGTYLLNIREEPIIECKAEFDELTENVQAKHREIEESLKSSLSKAKAELQEEKNARDAIAKSLQEKSVKLSQSLKMFARTQTELTAAQSEISAFELKSASQLKAWNLKKSKLTKQTDNLHQQLKELQQTAKQTTDEAEQIKQSLERDIQQLRQKLEHSNEMAAGQRQQNEQLSLELEEKTMKIAQNIEIINKIERELEASQAQQARIAGELESDKKTHSETSQMLANVGGTIEQLEKTNSAAAVRIKELEQSLKEKENLVNGQLPPNGLRSPSPASISNQVAQQKLQSATKATRSAAEDATEGKRTKKRLRVSTSK